MAGLLKFIADFHLRQKNHKLQQNFRPEYGSYCQIHC